MECRGGSRSVGQPTKGDLSALRRGERKRLAPPRALAGELEACIEGLVAKGRARHDLVRRADPRS